MNTNFIPAFPTWIADDSMSPGMTLRDYFAAMALQAISVESLTESSGNLKLLAKNSYHIADAMMEARK